MITPVTWADLVIRDAAVHTMDPAIDGTLAGTAPPGTAVAVHANRIMAVGDLADVRRHIGPRTEVIDGAGLVVTPGLVDSHQHPLMGLAGARGLDASGRDSLDELRDWLRAETAALPADAWVIVTGVEYEALAPPGMHRNLIDDAVGGRPAYLWLADCHIALMSTEGLRRAGITGSVEFGDRSAVVVDEDGVPTGLLYEMSAVLLGQRALPSSTVDDLARRVDALFLAQAACGITGVHVLDLWPDTEAVLTALGDRLPVRVLLAPWALPDRLDDTLDRVRHMRDREYDGRWRVGAVKFFLDGAIDGGAGWLHEPDRLGDGRAPLWLDPADYREAVRRVVGLGLPSFTHAIGDRAVSYALDTYERHGPPRGRRHRVEHAEVLADADVARFAELDVVASVQPTHQDWILPDHSDNWSWRLTPDRARHGWRYGDVVRAGGRVALGSDWPIAGYDPRVVMAGARLRRPAGQPDRAPVGADQALTPAQALAATTSWAAYGAGEEHVAGRIAPGCRADLTVFAGDPLTVPADELPDLPVALTMVDGRIVHRQRR